MPRKEVRESRKNHVTEHKQAIGVKEPDLEYL